MPWAQFCATPSLRTWSKENSNGAFILVALLFVGTCLTTSVAGEDRRPWNRRIDETDRPFEPALGGRANASAFDGSDFWDGQSDDLLHVYGADASAFVSFSHGAMRGAETPHPLDVAKLRTRLRVDTARSATQSKGPGILEDDGDSYKKAFAVAIDRTEDGKALEVDTKWAGEWVHVRGDGGVLRGYMWRSIVAAAGAASLTLLFSSEGDIISSRCVLAVSNANTGSMMYATRSFCRGRQPSTILTPPLRSEEVLIEVFLPSEEEEEEEDLALMAAQVSVSLERVYYEHKSDEAEVAGHGWSPSGECNVDVNCAIRGIPRSWESPRESDSIVQILSAGPESAAWCTGALINSIEYPGRQLLLTAAHCLFSSMNNPLGQHFWGFLFNHEVTGCSKSGVRLPSKSSRYVQGSVIKAFDDLTDIALVEITEQIPASAEPYFSGWDVLVDDGEPSRSVALHHPNGDLKKVSFDRHAPVGGCWCGQPCPCENPTHYIVQWDRGTTEKGSSGAPLYDARTRRIVGALTGGSASCLNVDGSDAFGKFRYAFTHQPQLRLLLAGCDSDCDSSRMFVDGASIDAEVHAMSNARTSAPEDQVIAIFKIDLYPDLFPGTQIVFMYYVFSHTCVLSQHIFGRKIVLMLT